MGHAGGPQARAARPLTPRGSLKPEKAEPKHTVYPHASFSIGIGLFFSLNWCVFDQALSPPFKDEGEVVALWGEAQLIKYLDGKLVLKGGSKEHRIAAREWISMFLNDAVVREG